MVEVRMKRAGDRFLLSASGHATGSPAVCAAVSALLYALAGYLINARSVKIHTLRMESGDTVLDAEGGQDMAAAFEMAGIGLMQLAQTEPSYIRAEILDGKRDFLWYDLSHRDSHPISGSADTGKEPAEEETHD